MIRRILSVASLTMRAAVRSRLVACLALVLVCVIIAMPTTAQGDGTLAGELQVLLHFTLGMSGFILGVATLWAACAAISRDIEERRIRLVAVKPVRKGEIWVGKWLGLMTLNAIMLLAVGAATCAFLAWRVHRHSGGPEAREAAYSRVLVGQRRILPRQEALTRETQAELEAVREHLAAEGKQLSGYERGSITAFFRRRLLAERAVVGAGEIKTWVFDLPKGGFREGAACTIRVNVSPVSGVMHPERGTWEIGSGDARHVADGAELVRSAGRMVIPGSLLMKVDALQVSYAHPPGERAILFDAEKPVELLVAEHSFLYNLCCSLLMVFFQLALLAALGLAAGTVFSFPVATFLSAAIVLLSATGHYFTVSEKSDSRSPIAALQQDESFLYRVGEALIVRLEYIAGPALRAHPFADLSDGILITGKALGQAGALMLIYVAVLALVSSAVLSRRELALP